MDDPKPVHKSKTIWVNVLMTLAGLSSLAGVIPSPAMPYVLAASGIANIALRFMTGQPIKFFAK